MKTEKGQQLPLESKDRIDAIKYSVSRFDGYFQSVNSKIALYITLSTFILTVAAAGGSSLLKMSDGRVHNLICLFLVLIILCAGVSLAFTIRASIPYLKNTESSIFFFGYVANQSTTDYRKKLQDLTFEAWESDLACQAQALAKGLQSKYNSLTIAGSLLFCDAILIIILSLITIINL